MKPYERMKKLIQGSRHQLQLDDAYAPQNFFGSSKLVHFWLVRHKRGPARLTFGVRKNFSSTANSQDFWATMPRNSNVLDLLIDAIYAQIGGPHDTSAKGPMGLRVVVEGGKGYIMLPSPNPKER